MKPEYQQQMIKTARKIKKLQQRQREIIAQATAHRAPLTKIQALEYSELSKQINTLHARLDTSIRETAAQLEAYKAPRESAPASEVEKQRAKYAAARERRQKKRRRTAVIIYILAVVALALGATVWAYIDSYRHRAHIPDITIHTTAPQAAGGAENEFIY